MRLSPVVASLLACGACAQTLTIGADAPVISVRDAVLPAKPAYEDILPALLLAIQTGEQRPEAVFVQKGAAVPVQPLGGGSAPAASLAAYRTDALTPVAPSAPSAAGWSMSPPVPIHAPAAFDAGGGYRPSYAPAPTATYAPPPVMGSDNLRGFGYHPYSASDR